DTLGGVQKALAALLIHGDKKRGLEELQLAIDKGERSRVEATIFLIEIYTSEEDTPEKALALTHPLRKEFPQSPAMHLAEIMALYEMKSWEPMMAEAEKFLKLSREESPYYAKAGTRPALYCLGTGELWGHHNQEKALSYFNEILSQEIDSSRWVTFAYL